MRFLRIIFILITVLALTLLYKFTYHHITTKYTRNMTHSKKVMGILPVILKRNKTRVFNIQFGHYFIPSSFKLKDWHNYTLIEHEKRRDGIGEQGKSASLPKRGGIIQEIKLMYKYRINSELSDMIALDRSLPDVRHPKCRKKMYIESLPSVSVVVAFFNEYLTTLLRTVHSILNRSPQKLIKEIILVDDGSTEDDLKEKLDNYVKMLPKVKMIRLANRTGVAGARLAGARIATAIVLIFLDSHMEVNVNWLPPLLEPISLDYRTAVVPIIDCIDRQNFEYRQNDGGARGWVDWSMKYVRNPLFPKEMNNLPEAFQTPVMRGVVAISRHFFWELGGYDIGLEIWGGEQMELSFKIWMCGGRLLEAPCSRIGHVVRDNKSIYESNSSTIRKNYRRVTDVWADEFAKYFYKKNSGLKKVLPGDIRRQKAFRAKCKPFNWFLTQIVPDVIQNYSLMNPIPLAEGWVRPYARTKLCLDAAGGNSLERVVLTRCKDDDEQRFMVTLNMTIRVTSRAICWETLKLSQNPIVVLKCCKSGGHNQRWLYNEDLRIIKHVKSGLCLDHDAAILDVFVAPCNEESETQRWVIEHQAIPMQTYNNWKLDLKPNSTVNT